MIGMQFTVRRAALAGVLAAVTLTSGIAGCAGAKKSSADVTMTQKADAATMVQFGSGKMESFMGHSQTEAIKNMLGGARGMFIAPNFAGGAALVGTENGTGYLMRRHGKEWSDPVFYKLTEFSVGYQVGAKESHMIILLMTDQAVDDFIQGKSNIGGTGGFAVGTLGMGASGAGGIKGGLELLIVSTNEGVFFGGGMSTLKTVPVPDINNDIYGKDANLTAVLAANGGKYAPATGVRDKLSQMVVQAWNQTKQ